MSHAASSTLRNGQVLAVAMTLLGTLVSFLGAPYPSEQRLQHVPTFFALVVLAWAARRRMFSNTSFFCILAFWWLHILGARWIYSYVPYDDWSGIIFGHRVSNLFGWTRNHYDRLVHFAFGALAGTPLVEMWRRWLGVANWIAVSVAFCIVMTIGGMYEIVEWQVAVWMSPDQAEAYNGQQGDMWDPQKDMALNALGAMMSAGVLLVMPRFQWTASS